MEKRSVKNFTIHETNVSCKRFGAMHDFLASNRDKTGTAEICLRCKTMIFLPKGRNNEFNNADYADLHELDFLSPEDYKMEAQSTFNV
jgi:hypothetical protein